MPTTKITSTTIKVKEPLENRKNLNLLSNDIKKKKILIIFCFLKQDRTHLLKSSNWSYAGKKSVNFTRFKRSLLTQM